jgi:hypothetical protein
MASWSRSLARKSISRPSRTSLHQLPNRSRADQGNQMRDLVDSVRVVQRPETRQRRLPRIPTPGRPAPPGDSPVAAGTTGSRPASRPPDARACGAQIPAATPAAADPDPAPARLPPPPCPPRTHPPSAHLHTLQPRRTRPEREVPTPLDHPRPEYVARKTDHDASPRSRKQNDRRRVPFRAPVRGPVPVASPLAPLLRFCTPTAYPCAVPGVKPHDSPPRCQRQKTDVYRHQSLPFFSPPGTGSLPGTTLSAPKSACFPTPPPAPLSPNSSPAHCSLSHCGAMT